MRSLTVRAPRRDPAPSRLGYRLHRLWLTPMVRRGVIFGVPLLAAGIIAAVVLTRTDIIENARNTFVDLRRTIEERPEFTVRLMAIDGGAPEIADDIREILPIDFPVTSFDLNLDQIRGIVEGLDAVKSASVYIRSGGILQIDLVERTPEAVWRGPQGLELVDASGHRVESLPSREERPDLPLIVGEGGENAVPEALMLYKDSGPLKSRIRGLQRIGERRWDMVLDRGQRILLPETDADLALERVLAMDKAYNLFARDVSRVDMRNPARPTVRSSQASVDYMHNLNSQNAGAQRNE